MTTSSKAKLLAETLSKRILVLDGAMGTALQNLNLGPSDFGGADLEGCNEQLSLTRPDAVEKIHEDYLLAGADIIETNTFGGTPLVLREYGLQDRAIEINRRAAEIARKAADRHTTSDRPRFVAGSMGPTTKAISVTGGVTFDELRDTYAEQAKGLILGGADYLLIETAQDARNVKAAVLGSYSAFKETGIEVPLAISGTIEPMGTTLAGQSIEALWASVAHLNPLYVGLNCATGPDFMTDHLRSLSALSGVPVACVPNAGLPDSDGCYLETPKMMAAILSRFMESGWVNLIGGCCGTQAEHIRAFSELVRGKAPRKFTSRRFSFLSGIDYLEVDDDKRPILVGERTNIIGSRKFKELIVSGDFEAGADIARGQVKHGAQVIDICLANPDRNELEDMEMFLEKAIKVIRAPLMIDSTDHKVIERALTYSQGKAIINSINLEDGEERFEKIVPLAKTFGAALVVGTIDDDPDQGMAITRQRKLDVAKRSYELLTKKYGFPGVDIYWDALTFPCATGDKQYVGSALETIEGLRLIKKEFPETKSILGISNVSFGLPMAGREILNSVFLYHCTQAGLDMAIVNTQQLERYPSIPDHERKLSEDLLFNREPDAIDAFAAYFRVKKPGPKKDKTKLPLNERLSNYIVEGSKDGLVVDLDLALEKLPALEVINGPLMKGMDEVGRLFAQNELIVAEVLQSAEVMKAAVGHLEKFMKKNESSRRGKVILATVKGDVHDIGKNLVEIILSNNGFEVVNLGIKVPPETLIQAAREHQPQIIGLSGLLVKSAQQMVTTAEDLSRSGITAPMLVGGAALSRTFTDQRIAKAYTGGTVFYASDAMNGLELAKVIVDPSRFSELQAETKARQAIVPEKKSAAISDSPLEINRSSIQPVAMPPSPPDFERHVLTNTPLEQIWSFINPRMLYGRHLGLPNSLTRLLEEGETAKLRSLETGAKAIELQEVVAHVKDECLRTKLLQPKAVYRFFHAQSRENTLEVQNATWVFPRQKTKPFLCISDYVGKDDNLCLFVVTAGAGVRERAQVLKEEGQYLKSHVLSALALETAEAYAEWLHTKIRSMWGMPDPTEMTMMDRFQAHYLGRRYSFGYPACPDLQGQKPLFDLLAAEEIGVELTDGFMMDPEASVSAIVMHHPEATYFAT